MAVADGAFELFYNGPGAEPAKGDDAISYLWANWGGCSAVDALAIQYMANSMPIYGSPWFWEWTASNDQYLYNNHYRMVADVNTSSGYGPATKLDNGITALDALTLKYRMVGLIPHFPYEGPPPNKRAQPPFQPPFLTTFSNHLFEPPFLTTISTHHF